MNSNGRNSDRGLYIAIFRLAEAQDVSVGKLGRFRFRRGVYFYAGSAQRNLAARLERHGTKSKPMRWHIDYLSTRARMLGAITIAAPRQRECEIAEELGAMFESAVPGFGASDCRCNGHLFYWPRLP
jgi:sugar fermentation stimulation protein A